MNKTRIIRVKRQFFKMTIKLEETVMAGFKKMLYIIIGVMIFHGLVNTAIAKMGMGSFGSGKPKAEEEKPKVAEEKPKTEEEKLEERRRRRPAKMQDVLWDKATQGMVRIFCKPSANLYIDGELQRDTRGRTRKSERFGVTLTTGTHVIKLERDGFEPTEKQITIEAGKPYVENFTLIKKGIKRGDTALIPAGEFWMGIDKYDLKHIAQKIGGEKRFHRNESPRHKVEVAAFHIDKYEVTNAQYKEFVDAAKREVLPDDWENGSYPEGQADFPVAYVTWHDADDYCRWAGKRLPSEEEWEKAARWAPDKKKAKKNDSTPLFPWGLRFNRNNANTATGGPGHTTITGQYEKGKSAYDIYDMSGNVKEWTADSYGDYHGSKYKDEFATEGEVRIARGGSFLEKHYECLTTCRYKYSPGTAYDDLGFRCAKDAK